MKQLPLADVFDAHVRHEFVDKDVDATIRTMTAEPYFLRLPRGVTEKAVRRFYEQLFVEKWPADTKVVRLSRTVGSEQVVDELLISFTQEVPMELTLPGVPLLPLIDAQQTAALRALNAPDRRGQPVFPIMPLDQLDSSSRSA